MSKREQNYYDLLNVARTAPFEEIEAAYKKACAMLANNSPALYSLYSKSEIEDRLAKLKSVYETMKDPDKRTAYDRSIGLKTASGSIPHLKYSAPSLESSEKDAFDEYAETGAFRDRIRLKRRFPASDGSNSAVMERYRMLYTRLEEITRKKTIKSVAITSAVKGEGKTHTAVNLSYLMAVEFRKKVLLLEADLRNPEISSSYIETGNLSGLVDVLKGDSTLEAATHRLDDTNLYILPARCGAKNSSEHMDSAVMRNALERVRSEYDYVIIDTPPVLPIVDTNLLAKSVDCFLLVVKAERTPKDLVIKAARSLPANSVAGIVLNAADEKNVDAY